MSSNNACDYTLGPWTVDLPWVLKNSGHYIVMAENIPIADCGPNGAANARFIAAAPELLELCRQALECLDKEWPREADKTNCLRQQLYGVIAKATGGQP